MTPKIEELKKNYADACNKYLQAFCDNYDFPYEKDAWKAGDEGTIALVGDIYFDFETIKYCVDNDLKDWRELLRWYDYTLDCGSLGLDCPNFPSWHKGCPRISDEKIKELLALKHDLTKAVEEASGKQKEVSIF